MNRRNRSFVDRLAQLSRQESELKSAQPFGSSNVVTYTNTTNATWDKSWTPTFGPGEAAGRNYHVTFTSDTQTAPFASIGVKALINDTTEYTVGLVDDVLMYTYLDTYLDGFLPNTQQVQWVVPVEVYASGTNVKLKFTVYATDTGNITIQEL